jgi:hypothetical protein
MREIIPSGIRSGWNALPDDTIPIKKSGWSISIRQPTKADSNQVQITNVMKRFL